MEHIHKPITIRKQLLRERGWTLRRVFDTNEHEPHKDVCSIILEDGTTCILRIGEHRPPAFFPSGYDGKHIVVPRLLETSDDPCYEIEALLPGLLLSEIDPAPTADSILRPDLLTKCIEGFWEIGSVFAKAPNLERRWNIKEKLGKHLIVARTLLTTDEQIALDALLTSTKKFWSSRAPAKWKYSADNILLLPDGRLGLVDLAQVGTYLWGYDLGWIVWPRWLHLPLEVWQNPQPHFDALERFIEEVIALAPSHKQKHAPVLRRCILLVLLERVIGSFYDVVNNTSHTHDPLENEQRRDAHIHFLHALLYWILSQADPQR
ncbi:MAG: hypothetical protein ABIG71_04910 [Candidatus Uhrbacteria bacterium]